MIMEVNQERFPIHLRINLFIHKHLSSVFDGSGRTVENMETDMVEGVIETKKK